MSKKKKRQHFVPVTYYSNFYSKETDDASHSVCGCFTCYRLTDGIIFNDKGKNVANEKLLYEFSDDPKYENYIENRFGENVEPEIGAFLKNLIAKLYCLNIGDVVLCDEEISMLHKFMVMQMFRVPITMPAMIILLKKFVFDKIKKPIVETKEIVEALTKSYLESISDLNSEFVILQAKALTENFYTAILKIDGFNLFTSDMPIMLTTDNTDISSLSFYDYDIMMPINPEFCVALFSKKVCDNDKLDRTMLLIEKEYEDDFLKAMMSSSDMLISNKMSENTKQKIDSIYPVVLKNRKMIKVEQENARKELGL